MFNCTGSRGIASDQMASLKHSSIYQYKDISLGWRCQRKFTMLGGISLLYTPLQGHQMLNLRLLIASTRRFGFLDRCSAGSPGSNLGQEMTQHNAVKWRHPQEYSRKPLPLPSIPFKSTHQGYRRRGTPCLTSFLTLRRKTNKLASFGSFPTRQTVSCMLFPGCFKLGYTATVILRKPKITRDLNGQLKSFNNFHGLVKQEATRLLPA